MRPDRLQPNPSDVRAHRRLVIVSCIAAAVLTAAVAWAEPTEKGGEGGEGETETGAERAASRTVDAIRFSHAKHGSVECSGCHGPAEGATELSEVEMSTCAECHGPGAETESGGPAAPQLRECSGCHVGYDRTVDEPIEGPADWRAVSPPPMIPPPSASGSSFDHGRHLEALADRGDGERGDAVCAECHGTGEPSLPGASSCRECHAKSESDSALKPANHTVAWERRHGTVALASGGSCRECHTEDDCQSCHDSQSAKPFSVHPPNFDTIHAADARANLDACTECHTVETFCRRCHAGANFAASPPDRPPARYDVHPPNWTKPGAPSNHAVQARQNIAECASCHTERDCVSCHSGVNPHPPDFQLKCRQWLKANPAPCAKCHGNLSSLRQKCL